MTCANEMIGRFRRLALEGGMIDVAAYTRHGKDPFEPLLDLTAPDAPVCVLGRTPGAVEVSEGHAFVGPAGQRIRSILTEFGPGFDTHGVQPSARESATCLLLNAVPYRLVACPVAQGHAMRVFHPLMLRLLAEAWTGHDVITVGPEAFFWFAIGQPPATRGRLQAFWDRGELRYVSSIDVTVSAGSFEKRFMLHPLPHPSQRNARWYASFPALLRCRLDKLLAQSCCR